jgi:GNAT superfamily N-acetyltransferase
VSYNRPRRLRRTDALDEFECRSVEQTDWLRRHARQADAIGTATVHVVTPVGDDRVVAYYAWCMASIAVEDAPERLRRGAGRYPQPVALLARLGVDVGHEGHGIGAALLVDVIARTATLGPEIGCRGLLIHCETTQARSFYMHLVPGFDTSPTDDLHLVLRMKDIRRSIGTDVKGPSTGGGVMSG